MNNRTFVGKVNGKTYDSIEDYNKAFLDAVGKGEEVTASIEFKPTDTEQERTYDPCLPDFDLDELTGVVETDKPVIDKFIKQDLSADRIKEILDRVYKMDDVDRVELETDVKDMIECIQADLEDNNHSHTILLKNMRRYEQEINGVQARLNNLKEAKDKIQVKINITDGADQVLKSSLEFYDTLYKRLSRGRLAKDQDPKVTGRVAEKGNPGFVLDHDQKEIARRLFKEIFGI